MNTNKNNEFFSCGCCGAITEWTPWGWHRVTYYGDLKEPVFALANALGWKVVEEA